MNYMKKELLKKLKELKPTEKLIDEDTEYWGGYSDALRTMRKIVKKLDLHNVTNRTYPEKYVHMPEYDDYDPDYDDSDECCDDCGCYHGHHPWCDS